jgi:hypothetical protein
MSMTFEAFSDLVDCVAALNGLTEELAAELVAEVGDTPMLDDSGLVVVTDGSGKEHRLKWPWEGDD